MLLVGMEKRGKRKALVSFIIEEVVVNSKDEKNRNNRIYNTANLSSLFPKTTGREKYYDTTRVSKLANITEVRSHVKAGIQNNRRSANENSERYYNNGLNKVK